LYSGGALIDLGALPNVSVPPAYSMAQAINSAGQIVGISGDQSGFIEAFLYSAGSLTPVGTLNAAYAINDAGQVAGTGVAPGTGYLHPFLYSNGTAKDLGVLPSTYDGYAFVTVQVVEASNEGTTCALRCDRMALPR
jgi:probable HAF family extracellular repeat protein